MSPSHAPDRAPPHALVTGGTGLIGRHTAAHLAERGWHVTVTGRGGRPAVLPSPIAYQSCDLLDRDACANLVRKANADVLVHLAWVTEHGRFWTAPENLDWVGASLSLARQFVEAGGRRIVAAGTCVEYRPPNEGPCVPGETALEPQFLYGVSKDAFRRALEAYARQSSAAVAWGRVFLLIGPGEAPGRLVPSIVRNLLAGKPAECSSGVQVRDFLDVRDCGRAFANLAMSAYEGPVNISTGVPRTIGDVARTTARLLGRPDLLRLGALRDRPGETHNLWGEATVLRDHCGFEPGYTLEQTLEAAIAYWQQQGAGNVDTN